MGYDSSMVIRFICPNGHQLSAPEDRAGKAAKCPKCQTAFLVPDEEEVGAADEERAGDEGAGDEGAGPIRVGQPESGDDSSNTGRSEVATTPQAGRDAIVFLCPNGHKLNGPASLKGRPGQCPHCNARFIIPDDEDDDEGDDEAEDEAEDDEEHLQEPEPLGQGPAEAAGDPVSAAEEFTDDIELVDDELIEDLSGVSVIHDQGLAEGHPMERLLAIFQPKDDSPLRLDIHLKDGQTVQAGQFSQSLSRQEFAVFATADGDDSPVISVIRWDEISRVTIRGLKQLPEEWS